MRLTGFSPNVPMACYYDLLAEILREPSSNERTGTGARKVFGRQLRFNLNEGFPLLTGKHVPFKLVASELLWFLSGSTNNNDLRKLNGNDRSTIWEEWASDGKSGRSAKGALGPMYSEQWREWFYINGAGSIASIDQIVELIENIKKRPNSRRHLVSAWNVADLPDESISPQQNVDQGRMAIAPCHFSFQMDVNDDRLSCMVNMRSADMFLGVPFNIGSYALLTHMIAEVTGLCVGDLIVSMGNAHIYDNHVDQVKEMLCRDLTAFPLSTLMIKRKINSIDDFTLNDLEVINYKSHESIKASVAI